MTNRNHYPRSLSSPEGFFNFLPTSYIARPPSRLQHRRSMATNQIPENQSPETSNSQSMASGLSLLPRLDPHTLRGSWNNVVQETINAVARVHPPTTQPMSMSSWLHSRSHRPSLLAVASGSGGATIDSNASGDSEVTNPNQVVLDLQYIDKNEETPHAHTSNIRLDLSAVNSGGGDDTTSPQSPTTPAPADTASTGVGAATPPPPPSPPSIPPTSETGAGGTDSEPAAGNTEESTAEILRQNPEATAFLIAFFKYLPFIVILLAKAFYDHICGIFLFVALFATFRFYNVLVKRSASQVDQQTKLPLLFGVIHLIVTIAVFYLIYNKDQLYKVLIFVPPNNDLLKNLVQLIWIIIISDFIIKLCTIIVKIMLTLLPSVILPSTKRGKWYLFIELTSQFYRSLVPIQLWLIYLMESYQSHQKVVGVFLSAAYIVAKGSNIMQVAKAWWKSVTKLLDNIQLGVSPTKETLLGVGCICPICHDEFKSPVQLTCCHVFCESCVSKWFDREQTCPLCRAKLVDDPSWRDGATSYFVQLF